MSASPLARVIPLELRSGFVADALTLAVGTALAQALTVLASPVLTRLYSPEEFGLFSLFSVIVSTAGVLACLCYEPAIVLPADDRDAARLLVASVAIAGGMAALGFVLVLAWGRAVAEAMQAPGLHAALWWAPASLLAVGAAQALSYWGNRRRRFRALSASRVCQAGVTAIVHIGTGAAGGGAAGLVGGMVLGQVGALAPLVGEAVRSARRLLDPGGLAPRAWLSLLYAYRGFPLYSSLGTLMNVAAFHLVPLLLSTGFGPAVAGLYFLGYRVVSVPMSFLGASLGQVLLQRAAEELAQQRGVARLVEATIGRSLVLAVPGYAVVALLAPEVFAVAFGPEWAVSGRYVQALTPLFFLQFVTSPASMVLIALQKQRVAASLQGLLLLGAVGSLGAGIRFLDDPLAALRLYAAVEAALYVVYLVAIARCSAASGWAILREAAFVRGFRGRV